MSRRRYPRRCIALCEREIHLDRIGGSIVVDRRPAGTPPDCVPIWLFEKSACFLSTEDTLPRLGDR
ncbi:hypothetical protein [Methylorubrum extorquens]|nr:hypothetical protein [Methylorubrum extorquens]MCP1535483.1 hypothetical protein [Methylorubrum extorquens]